MTLMDEIKIELSDEARKQLIESANKLVEAFTEFWQIVEEIVMRVMEELRKIAEQLGRFFLLQQLLEWRVPYSVADWMSRKISWYWGWRIGMRWFENKLLATE